MHPITNLLYPGKIRIYFLAITFLNILLYYIAGICQACNHALFTFEQSVIEKSIRLVHVYTAVVFYMSFECAVADVSVKVD